MIARFWMRFQGRWPIKLRCEALNVDENSDTPMKYGIRSLPTLLLFKDGEVVVPRSAR